MNDLSDWALSLAAAVFPALGGPQTPAYNGYAEADYVYVAPASAGRLSDIAVAEGDRVATGDLMFRLDDAHQTAALRGAEAEVAVARANLDNLSTGSRSEEIDVIRASLQQSRADQKLAATNLTRSETLRDTGAVSQARVDADRTAFESASAKVAQLQAQLQVAELPARDAQRIAAEASLRAALAKRDDAKTALDDREVTSPAAGFVDKVYYTGGEVAGAGAPVIAIFPPDALKALFFVPEPDRASIRTGQTLTVSCNGCPAGVTATVTRLATTPQYTPPIIYSREERARLVYRAEARLDGAEGLLPGQPLTLSPQP
ncbi:secretion protein HlyD [Primorskyibacter flagellatus]|uniref:Secretion protein HlyD n=1 Tax=Primorskyibacter flagellatus TaxID=1387277 RepID=A0A917A878_9RHOB|nr:HlyD family efflux transporter periplasmic adaptor subunit [Primorskyibacter flagellatus]GGE32575.1 secretion protein HlyD [Primorskyibacter flagellatus]